MGVHSGKFGTVNGISTVRNWQINDSMQPKEYVASNTLFGKGRESGIEDWGGSYNFYGRMPSVMPGESFSFAGFTAPDNDASGNGVKYTGTALVESIVINWNWGAAEIINGTVNFKGHLALTNAVASQVLDETEPDIFSPIGTKITFSSDLEAWTEWTNLLTATLTLTNALQPYNNSSSVVSGHAWTGQKPGNLDWTLAVAEQDTDRTRFAKGANLGLRIYTEADAYWELVWAKVGEFTGLTVDRESGAIMQQTVNLAMNGFKKGGTPAIGRIVLPDETLWWGEAAA